MREARNRRGQFANRDPQLLLWPHHRASGSTSPSLSSSSNVAAMLPVFVATSALSPSSAESVRPFDAQASACAVSPCWRYSCPALPTSTPTAWRPTGAGTSTSQILATTASRRLPVRSESPRKPSHLRAPCGYAGYRAPNPSVFDNPGIGLSARDIANNLSHRRGGDFGASESRGISAADAARTALRMPLVDVQAPQDPCGGGA